MFRPLTTLAACLFVGITSVENARGEVPGEVVRFKTSDSIEIVGDYIAPPRSKSPAPCVVLVHMLRVDRSSWAPMIPKLHKAGLAVLSIDLRGHGDSGAPQRDEMRRRAAEQDVSLFHEMHRDVEAAVSWLVGREEVDKTRLALIGATVGFSVALDYATHDPSIDVIVGLTPGSGYVGMDSVSGALMYGKRPMLLLAVETDSRATETISRMNPMIEVNIVGSGTGHGTRMLTQYEKTPGEIIDYVLSNLGEPSSSPVVFEFGDREFYTSMGALRNARPDQDGKVLRWCSSAGEAENRGLSAAH